ncbi:hypothetical protein A2Z33_00560 [Candidatus Gottesmanbacteria bacterium RBG_16_52_11]|uniref:Glycoside hydrolase family 5 domain-containing protein n=1 Tax=Candidatus Gottesmanbacteria bacterium RBG_16_52_11 TaxID=1798374 RepID=A0A1F5YNA4_9BACT|nr:MAG: hypothetical protein A2Z33_00560 [Candidatus Gottesmanbacteria bacterium RBG_16_52_11]
MPGLSKKKNKKNRTPYVLLVPLILLPLLLLVFLLYSFSNIKDISPKRSFAQNRYCRTPVLTRSGKEFLLGNTKISRFGLRAVNALESDSVAQSFINNLNKMKAYGIQSVNLNLQGGNTYQQGDSTINSFNSDGTLKPEFKSRLKKILNAVAQRNMVSVISVYYQRHDTAFANEQAALNAAKNTMTFLENNGWCNIWMYTINEYWVRGFEEPYGSLFQTVDGQRRIYNAVKSVSPEVVTYVSEDVNDGFYARTAYTATDGNIVIEFRRLDDYEMPGVFTAAEIQETLNSATTTFQNKGYWFYHAAWHQSVRKNTDGTYAFPRFDPGGNGTSTSPGTKFIWDHMRDLSNNTVIRMPEPFPTP